MDRAHQRNLENASKTYSGKVLIFIANMLGLFLLKVEKGITITNAFQEILRESNCTANKIWVDKGNEFYNRSMKLFLQNINREMYSMYNE